VKKKNRITKHDIRRRLQSNEVAMMSIVDRLAVVESVFSDFLKMQKVEDKFKKYLDGKYKQSEHKQS
jgi:hypothetical protein